MERPGYLELLDVLLRDLAVGRVSRACCAFPVVSPVSFSLSGRVCFGVGRWLAFDHAVWRERQREATHENQTESTCDGEGDATLSSIDECWSDQGIQDCQRQKHSQAWHPLPVVEAGLIR
ncbi:hypothetical protein D3C81_1763150 [compost metagenome]